MKRVDRIAFVRRGTFSHTNQCVLNALRAEFPKCSVDVIDVRDLRVLRWPRLPHLGLAAVKYYGLASLRNKRAFMRSLAFTPTYVSEIRRQLLRRLQRQRYLFTFQTQGLFDASVPGTPHFVYTDHTHLANLEYPSFRRDQLHCREWLDQERTIYHRATVTFTMSSNIARSLIRDYDCRPERVQCVYVGTNATPDLRGCENGREDKKILFVGVDWERKGGPILVEAFRRVLKVHPTAELIVVGCSPKPTVPQCTVVGRVPLEQVSAYYEKASILCVPTRIEPFGIVFIEALAHGVPVVATRIGALPDFVLDDETGYLVEPDDVEDLAARLIDLIGDHARQQRLGQRGRMLVESRYTWPHVAATMRKTIERHLS
jgi:glycosyltransferase involved in cell wall biosynthesis